MQFRAGPAGPGLPVIPTPPHIACLEELMGGEEFMDLSVGLPSVDRTVPGTATHQGSHDMFATCYGSAGQVSGSVASGAAATAGAPSSSRPQRSKRGGRVAVPGAADSRAAAGARKQPHVDAEGRPISRFKANRLRVKQNLSNMEAAVEQMLQELQLLALENQQLRLKAHALETVVHVRERHVRLLHTCGPPLPQRSEAAVAARALSLHNMHSDSSGSSRGRSGGPSSASSQGAGGSSGSQGDGGSCGSGWGAVASGEAAAGGESSWPALLAPPGLAAAGFQAGLGLQHHDEQEEGEQPQAQAAQQHGSGQCVVFSGTRPIGSQPMDAATLAAAALVAQPIPPPPPAAAPAASPPLAASAAAGRGRRAGSGGARRKGGGSGAGAAGPPVPVDWPPLLDRVLRRVAGFQHPRPPVSAELCKTMPLEQLVACWKCYVADSAALLLELETAATAAEAAAVRQRLQTYHETGGFSGLNVFVLNPASVVRICVLDFEAGGEVDPHQKGGHWASVLSGLRLSQQQQELFLTLFELCARDMLAVSRQRKQLFFSAMAGAAAAAAAGGWEGEGATGEPVLPPPAAAQAAAAAGLAAQVAKRLQPPSLQQQQQQQQFGSDGGSSPPQSSQLLDTLGRVQATVARELLAIMTLNASFINELLDGEQAARFAVLSWPLFPNTLGVAIALAKAVDWKPKAGPLAKGSITRTTSSSASRSSQAATSSGQAQASCSSLVACATTAQSAPAAAAAAESSGQRRASVRRQSSRLGSLASCPQAPGTAAAAAAAAPLASAGNTGVDEDDEEEEQEEEEPVEMPPDVSDVLNELQGGRLAAATTILQATEQAVQLGRFVEQPSLALCRALQHGGSSHLWHAGVP